MAEVKKILLGLNTNRASSWRFAFPLLYFGFMTLGQSGLVGSPFIGPYLLFIPMLFIGYCYVAFVRSWHATPAGLSVKTLLFILGKQFNPFLLVLVLFTNCVSLLYAILAHPPYITMMHALYLWVDGVVTIGIPFLLFIAWLRRRHPQRKPNRNAVQGRMFSPLQQQKRP